MASLLHQRNVPNGYPTTTEQARAEAPGSLCKFVSKQDIGAFQVPEIAPKEERRVLWYASDVLRGKVGCLGKPYSSSSFKRRMATM